MIKKLLKYVSLIVILIIFVFVFIVNFSTTETKYYCTGEMIADNTSDSANFFMVHTEYRFWVHLWGKSDGKMLLEYPDGSLDYYFYLKDRDPLIYIHESTSDTSWKGRFSSLSKKLSLTTYLGRFTGKCEQVKD